jgi:TRAP-type C4-dicarboxylate transport system substrate-binding protein
MNPKKVMVFGVLIFVVLGLTTPAASQSTKSKATLKEQLWRFSNFLPPGHWSNWCNSFLLDQIEKRTNGKIKTRLYVGEALGKAAEHYNMVVTGRAEIGELTTGFAPGTFPLCDVLKLPFSWNSALEGSLVAGHLLRNGYLDDTLRKDVKTIAINMTIPLKIWTKKPVSTLEGLKGLRLRVSGGLDIQTIEALGINAIAMPLPEVYPALEKGVIDGGVYGEENAVDFKYAEVVKYMIDLPLCYAVHLIFLNRKIWDSLPKDTQATLEEAFREEEIHWGETLDVLIREKHRTILREKYNYKVVDISPSEVEKIKVATSRVKDDWIANMEKKGLPGKKNYDAMITAMKNYGIIFDQTWVKNRALGK